MSWQLVFTKQAQKDAKKLAASNLKAKAQALLNMALPDLPWATTIPRGNHAKSQRLGCYIWWLPREFPESP